MQKHQNTGLKNKKGLTNSCQSFFYRYLFRLYYLFSAIICSKSPSILIL